MEALFDNYGIQISLITAWICNRINYKVWGVITDPFLNFNGATIEV